MLYIGFCATADIEEGLQRILSAQHDLDPFTQFPYEFSGELRRAVLAQSVHYSTRIEGNTLTLEQVRSVLAGRPVAAPAAQIQEVENYRDAISFVQSLATGREFAITEETIRTIHFLVTKNLSTSYASGRYRTEQNFVVDRNGARRVFFPPPPQEVPALMSEYVTWLNSRHEYPTPIKAALAHLNLVAIHPFLDGNGRTARILDSLVMYADGFRAEELVSLETYYGQDHQAYYHALSSALGPHYSPPRDATPWVEYHVRAHAVQSQAAVRRFQTAVDELPGMDLLLGPFDLTPDQLVGAVMTCHLGSITNRVYRQATDRSAQEAIADFNLLIEKGLLVRTGGGRSTAYVPSERLQKIYSDIISGTGSQT